MFTGLIQEMGEILSIKGSSQSKKIKIKAKKVLENVKIGDSIATNGVCLTVTSFSKDYFEADVMNETIERSTLKRLLSGSKVNLEKSLTLNDFLGGHLVYGDVDCEGIIKKITKVGIAKIYRINLEKKYMKYIVEKGRISIDGASLTVMNTGEDYFEVSLIPHTLEFITIGTKTTGDYVNLETDMLAKYAEKILLSRDEIDYTDGDKKEKSKMSLDFLRKNGF
ncbi:MAG: riboflavin synthase [Leptotrichiaceae bacterium]